MTNTRRNPINYEARIFRDPQICGGEPVFKLEHVSLCGRCSEALPTATRSQTFWLIFPALSRRISRRRVHLQQPQKKIFLSRLSPRFDENQAGRESSSASCIQTESAWS
jgi:hypothetical protein